MFFYTVFGTHPSYISIEITVNSVVRGAIFVDNRGTLYDNTGSMGVAVSWEPILPILQLEILTVIIWCVHLFQVWKLIKKAEWQQNKVYSWRFLEKWNKIRLVIVVLYLVRCAFTIPKVYLFSFNILDIPFTVVGLYCPLWILRKIIVFLYKVTYIFCRYVICLLTPLSIQCLQMSLNFIAKSKTNSLFKKQW